MPWKVVSNESHPLNLRRLDVKMKQNAVVDFIVYILKFRKWKNINTFWQWKHFNIARHESELVMVNLYHKYEGYRSENIGLDTNHKTLNSKSMFKSINTGDRMKIKRKTTLIYY